MSKKAQSMIEYSILFAVIAASLILMKTYLQRGFSGRIKQQADSMGTLYDPENIDFTSTLTASSHTVTTTAPGIEEIDGEEIQGLITTEIIDYDNITQTTNQTITK